MPILPALDRLATASVVCFGRRGDITRHARVHRVSRQRLYRQADRVLRDLDTSPHAQRLAHLQEQVALLQSQLELLQASQRGCVVFTKDLQAQFVSTACAEGVSLPVTRRLLEVFLGDDTPSVATLGRQSHQAALRANSLLNVFEEHARPRVRQVAAAEIFFGQKPVLMVVEPESLCWLSGRLSPSRDGEEWAKELQQLPALEHLARDGGKGLQNGLARVNEVRQQENQPVITEQLDHFHTFREGRRGLRKVQAQAERAWTAAEEADKKVARVDRQGQALTGYATQAVLKWQKAEDAFHDWERVEPIVKQIRQTLLPFTAEGELNTRQRAVATVEALVAQLDGEVWDKFKRQLRRPETYT